jgi:hypothetical protein
VVAHRALMTHPLQTGMTRYRFSFSGNNGTWYAAYKDIVLKKAWAPEDGWSFYIAEEKGGASE